MSIADYFSPGAINNQSINQSNIYTIECIHMIVDAKYVIIPVPVFRVVKTIVIRTYLINYVWRVSGITFNMCPHIQTIGIPDNLKKKKKP